MAESTLVYEDYDGKIICEDCAKYYNQVTRPRILEDIGCGCPECVPMFCDSCSEPLCVEKN
jgi:hypothetical protein